MLTSELAQKIVNSIIPIIDRNINIMDVNGIIIGSGHPDRLGRFHKIAYNVIQNPYDEEYFGKIYDVDSENNMKPGVNLPIFFKNHVIGAVGITGKPEEVMIYAKLIQITVQLLVWREYNASSQDVKRMLMSEFINNILDKKEISENFLNEMKSSKIDYEKLSYCIILKSDEASYKGTINLIDDTMKFFPNSVVGRYDNDLVIFMDKEPSAYIINILKEQNIKLYMGCKINHWTLLFKSYFVAKAMILLNFKNEYFSNYSNHKLDIAIIINYLDYPYLYESDLKKFNKIKNSDSLLETYKGFLKYNGVIKDICSNLYIHRNTVIYRLDKIKELTGFDINVLEQAYRLYSLYIITEINQTIKGGGENDHNYVR